MNAVRERLRAQLMTGSYARNESKGPLTTRHNRRVLCSSTKDKKQLEARLSLTSVFIVLVKICIVVLIAFALVRAENMAMGLFIFCALPYFMLYQLMTLKKELLKDIPYRTPAQFYRSQELQAQQARKARQNKRARYSSRSYISNKTPIAISECSSTNTEFAEPIDSQEFWLSQANNNHVDDDDRYSDPIKREFYGIEPKISSCFEGNNLDITLIENEMTSDCSLLESSLDDISGFGDDALSLD